MNAFLADILARGIVGQPLPLPKDTEKDDKTLTYAMVGGGLLIGGILLVNLFRSSSTSSSTSSGRVIRI